MILEIVTIVVGLGSICFNLLIPRHRAVDLVYRSSAIKLKGLRDEVKYDRIETEKLRSTSIQLANQAQGSMQDAAESLRLAEAAMLWAQELNERTAVLKQEDPEPEVGPRRVGSYWQ